MVSDEYAAAAVNLMRENRTHNLLAFFFPSSARSDHLLFILCKILVTPSSYNTLLDFLT